MTGRSHDLASAASAFAVVQALNLETEQSTALVIGALITARLPDQLEVFGLPHRGPTHSLLAGCCVVLAVAVVVSLVLPAWTVVAGGAVAIGYGTHLLADAATKGGVRLLWPFSERVFWLLPPSMRLEVMPERWRLVKGKPKKVRVVDPRELAFQAVVVLALASYVWFDGFPKSA